jgi:hypothetical protein
MPKQKIHEGRTYSLIPMKEPDGSVARGEDGRPQSRWYNNSFVDTAEQKRLLEGFDEADALINDHEPHAYIQWDKAREAYEGGQGVGDQGYVYLSLEVTPEWLRLQLSYYEVQLAASKSGSGVFAPDPHITLGSGPLTWQDLNVLAKTARDARDGAFGKPE